LEDRAHSLGGHGARSLSVLMVDPRARLADAPGYWRAIATRSRSSGVIR
jgi:hypothetical protein